MSTGEPNGHYQLPHAPELEASILGGIILRNEALALVPDLETEDFYDSRHKVVFTAIRNLEARSRPIDVALLAAEIERDGKLDAIGGVAFLGELTLHVPTVDNVVAYTEEVKLAARNRRVILELGSALERAKRGLFEPAELLSETIRELQRIEPPRVVAPRMIGRTWDDCVEEIYARKDEPWIDIRIGETVIATCRNGSFVPLVAPSGAGKSTLVLQMLVDHALQRGPAIYLTYELDGDEAVARAIGQRCSVSWAAVLRGEVPRAQVPSVKRLRILERDEATLDNLGRLVAELRASHPDEPIFVVVDYLQALPAPPGKERGVTANVSANMRIAAKKHRVVLIGVSQASTANATKMRTGELLGIDSASTGAETAQIDRDAYVILTLGARRKIDPDTVAWKLSVAKYRFGEADLVHEAYFYGRVGSWEIIGGPITATEARAAASAKGNTKKREELKRSIVALLAGSPIPMSKNEVTDASTGSNGMIAEVINELLLDRSLVHVEKKRGGAQLIWTPGKEAAP